MHAPIYECVKTHKFYNDKPLMGGITASLLKLVGPTRIAQATLPKKKHKKGPSFKGQERRTPRGQLCCRPDGDVLTSTQYGRGEDSVPGDLALGVSFGVSGTAKP